MPLPVAFPGSQACSGCTYMKFWAKRFSARVPPCLRETSCVCACKTLPSRMFPSIPSILDISLIAVLVILIVQMHVYVLV